MKDNTLLDDIITLMRATGFYSQNPIFTSTLKIIATHIEETKKRPLSDNTWFIHPVWEIGVQVINRECYSHYETTSFEPYILELIDRGLIQLFSSHSEAMDKEWVSVLLIRYFAPDEIKRQEYIARYIGSS